MRTRKILLSLLLTLCLMLSFSTAAFAASYTGEIVAPGLSGIQPGDELTHPDNTDWATLTASWGVRVTFIDWDETELKTELVPVTDTTPGCSSAPADPTRDGYTFTGWERYDSNAGPATLNDDGSVTDVNGPGPIVFIATYEKNPVYKVTYVVNSDDTYGMPEDSETPVDSKEYSYEDLVEVADALVTGCNSATVDGKEVKGTWEFVNWDKEDFRITEDTVITGSWKFTPDTIPDTPDAPDTPDTPDAPENPVSPQTGENSHLALWVMLLAVSAAGITLAVVWGKKSRKTN